jgi:divalent metal cation (Fe/Co/Zn/Cd) transporter
VERRAARLVGAVLVLVAIYLTVGAVAAFTNHSEPQKSPLGMALTGGSIVVLPILAMAKLRLARALDSRALRGDGVLSGAGALLAFAALIALVLNSGLGWWWADSIAALVIAVVLFWEGRISLG